MTHLTETTLYTHVFDQVALAPEAATHLTSCAGCRAQLTKLQHLWHELAVGKRSEIAPQTLANYRQLFEHVPKTPSAFKSFFQWLRAELTWDSRSQPAWQGVRNAGTPRYRLLYTTPRAEVELMVEPQAGRFNLEGELLPLEAVDQLLPALLELQDPHSSVTLFEAESDKNGRFHLPAVPQGRYTMLITPSTNVSLLIEDLEIS